MNAGAAERIAAATTLLFTPADSERRLAAALRSDADIVVADLEDAIAPAAKAAARACLEQAGWGAGTGPLRCVRVNAQDTGEHAEDMALVERLGPDLVMVPKADAAALAGAAWPAPVVAIVETPAGVREAYEIASVNAVAMLLFGSIDLSATLAVGPLAADDALLFARSSVVLDSAAAGVRPPFDGVHLDLADRGSLTAEARRARELGFGGKACVHPDQLGAVAAAFAPSAEEVAWASRVVEASSAADDDGRGVSVVDGAMVDAPVVARARGVLAQAAGARGAA